MIADWVIAPREHDLTRLYDPISKWSSLTLFERDIDPDTWSVTGPSAEMAVFKEQSGCILFRNGEQITSGVVFDIHEAGSEDSQGRMSETTTVTFASDLFPVTDFIVVPSPAFSMPTGTIFTFPDAYDLRTDAIETLILGYIRSNTGDLAAVNRRTPRLRLPASQGRGGTTTVTGRFDHLGVLVSSLADAGNLRVRVIHTEDGSGAWRDIVIDTVQDRSADIRFGSATSMSGGSIAQWSHRRTRPSATRAIIGGGGQLAARDILHLTNPTAENAWKTIAERFVDQRNVAQDNVNKLSELTREGGKDISEGAGEVAVTFKPRLNPDLALRQDIRVGDIVGYDLPRLPPGKDKIREVKTVVTNQNRQATETVTITVGTPESSTDPTQRQSRRALRDIDVLQRS